MATAGADGAASTAGAEGGKAAAGAGGDAAGGAGGDAAGGAEGGVVTAGLGGVIANGVVDGSDADTGGGGTRPGAMIQKYIAANIETAAQVRAIRIVSRDQAPLSRRTPLHPLPDSLDDFGNERRSSTFGRRLTRNKCEPTPFNRERSRFKVAALRSFGNLAPEATGGRLSTQVLRRVVMSSAGGSRRWSISSTRCGRSLAATANA